MSSDRKVGYTYGNSRFPLLTRNLSIESDLSRLAFRPNDESSGKRDASMGKFLPRSSVLFIKRFPLNGELPFKNLEGYSNGFSREMFDIEM